ncbi:conserved hypothetical protein [Vibrio phage 501E54-1]|nr:conserved hypothetical protein [Vibrio phage 501E54-1]
MDVNSIPSDVELLAVSYRKNLYSYLQERVTKKLRDTDKKAINENLKLFLYNCLVSSASSGTFAMTLDKNHYSKSPIRNGVTLRKKPSYRYTKKILDYFTEKGLIEYELGHIEEWNNYKVRGKWFNDPVKKPTIVTLRHTFKDYCMDLEITPEAFFQINCLILRNKDKQDIKFKREDKQKEKITMLNSYNVRALKSEITKTTRDGKDKYLLQLRKIYNGDFETGGRMYDLVIQQMSKQERKCLLIDKEDVLLLDYKAFETSIAYTLCDEKMRGDPYTIEFEEYHPKVVRDVCKLIMTRIYNCDNEKTLNYLVNEYIRENFNLDKLVEEGKIPEKRIPVGMFLDILMQKHEAIEEYFFGKGEHNLQYVGSQVMDYVIEKSMQNHEKLVIPVFDEVVCPVSMKNSVLGYMRDAYDNILGSPLNCKIEVE